MCLIINLQFNFGKSKLILCKLAKKALFFRLIFPFVLFVFLRKYRSVQMPVFCWKAVDRGYVSPSLGFSRNSFVKCSLRLGMANFRLL